MQFCIKLFLTAILFCIRLTALTQTNISLQLIAPPEDRRILNRMQLDDRTFPDTIALKAELQLLVTQLRQQAYLEASIDQLIIHPTQAIAHIHLGPKYFWGQLNTSNIPPPILTEAGFKPQQLIDQPFNHQTILNLQQSIIRIVENNGYPFAKITFDSLLANNGKINGTLDLQLGTHITIRKITVKGDADISIPYLYQYLGLESGQPYAKNKLLKIRDRLQELPFLQIKQDPQIRFIDNQIEIDLFIDKKRSSQFDFLIGFQPNSSELRRFILTGTFKGAFQNQFGLGEKLFLAFEQLRPQTQNLDVSFQYPYIVGLPIGIDFQFDLYKRDTTYLDLDVDLGISYLVEGNNFIKVLWNRRNSTLLNIERTLIENTQTLPPNLDIVVTSFGLQAQFENLDYRFNPRKGWSINGRMSAGRRSISRNRLLQDLELDNLYDSIALRSTQFKLIGQLNNYLPLGSNSTFKTALNAGFVLSDGPVYQNEQFRIGGNRLLRGFDDELLFVTRYVVSTAELRLLLGTNSNLFTFLDYAYVDYRTNTSPYNVNTVDYPVGFGLGMNFETKAGLFGLTIAFGQRRDEPFDFNAPKVHFGYVNLF